jgi:hypothetical protein
MEGLDPGDSMMGSGRVGVKTHSCHSLDRAHSGLAVRSEASYAAALRGSLLVNRVANAIVDGADPGVK